MPADSPQEPWDEAEFSQRRSIGVDVSRPYPAVVRAANFAGWFLIFLGMMQIIIGAVIFNVWKGVGCFWVGMTAWMTGLMGTCVSQKKNSGGPPTAVFFVLAMLCVLAATLGLLLVDGRAYRHVRASDGNCFDVSSTCTDGDTCAKLDCVCWKPDGSTTCDGGTSKRYCFNIKDNLSCNDIRNTEGILLASSVLLAAIDILAISSVLIASATICCCRYNITLQRGNGIGSHVPPAAR